MASDPVRVLLHVAALLDRIGTPYFLGGSLASSLLGGPRSTVDIDFEYLGRWAASLDLGGLLERALAESGFPGR